MKREAEREMRRDMEGYGGRWREMERDGEVYSKEKAEERENARGKAKLVKTSAFSLFPDSKYTLHVYPLLATDQPRHSC